MIRSWSGQRRREAALRGLVLAIAVGIVLLPLIWTMLAAVGIQPDNHTSPPSWVVRPSLDHLADVSTIEPAFWQELATSVGLSVGAAVVAVTLSFLAAYGIARPGRRAARRLNPALLVLATLPAMAYVLPLRDVVRRFGLLDTIPGILLAEVAATAPLAVYVFIAHLAGGSRDREEAAGIDGASPLQILRDVVLPDAASIVAATTIVLIVLDWNFLLTPLVLTGINVRTLPVVLTDLFTLEREVDWPTAAAALTISFVPLVALIGLLHRVVERFNLAGGDPSGDAT